MYVAKFESDNCTYKISTANTVHVYYVFYSVIYLPKHGSWQTEICGWTEPLTQVLLTYLWHDCICVL